MSIKLEHIDDPKLRSRILRALNDADQLSHELKANRSIQSPQPQPTVRNEPLAEGEGKKEGAQRTLVRITSFRSRLCDTDNICIKYILDSLRYCGLIKDDRPEDIELVVAQEKCSKAEERTEILLTY